jgi:NAD(P)-dependent dehydrogenase (short-subunit alcohol dehydrogenase family)
MRIGQLEHHFHNAARGAVTNLTGAQALDLGPQGMRVNAGNPTLMRPDTVHDDEIQGTDPDGPGGRTSRRS